MNRKILVAYFSASGETEKLAGTIADVTGGSLFEIRPEKAYTSGDLNWHDKKSRSSVEMNDKGNRPAIAGEVADMDQYDTVFVGFPNMKQGFECVLCFQNGIKRNSIHKRL